MNGYSGYLPSHYPALRDAFRAEEDAGFEWLRRAGALHVIAPLEAPRLVALVERQPGAVRMGRNSWAAQYELPQRPSPPPVAIAGERLPISRAQSHCSSAFVALLHDGDERVPWRCAEEDRQELTVDLGRVTSVGMVVHHVGTVFWEYPKRLQIDLSEDGTTWQEARTGSVLGEVLEGAFADPRSLAVVLPFEPRPARFIRLRHRSFEAGDPWTITEIEVRGAPEAAPDRR